MKPTHNEKVVALNVRVPESLRREMRVYALQRGMTVADLLTKAFQALKQADKSKAAS